MKRAFLTIAMLFAMLVGSLGINAATNVQDASAHTYYTCEGRAIGGGGYVSRWEDTVGGWTHYRASTFWTTEYRYVYVYRCIGNVG